MLVTCFDSIGSNSGNRLDITLSSMLDRINGGVAGLTMNQDPGVSAAASAAASYSVA
jgi:hypothetical protein